MQACRKLTLLWRPLGQLLWRPLLRVGWRFHCFGAACADAIIAESISNRLTAVSRIHVFPPGMMNTADRSLALVDYALRRRFAFERLNPMFGQSTFKTFLEDGGADPALVAALSERLIALNEAISDDPNLGSGFSVGHSYFCRPGAVLTAQDYFDAVRNEILPLLEEYWVDDRDLLEKWRGKLLADL
jgi:5-methylcytosine-specific restriction enzyme B